MEEPCKAMHYKLTTGNQIFYFSKNDLYVLLSFIDVLELEGNTVFKLEIVDKFVCEFD
jgi:hypothetical protein